MVASPEPSAEKLIPIGEAAQYLGINVSLLRTWTNKGIVQGVVLPSGYRRYLRDELVRVRREVLKLPD
jgi:DNA-binding transcriptional MerR regulator